MDICIYGIGGIGGSVGGLLCNYAKTKKDLNIYFIARGKHLDAIRQNGLQLQLPDNNTICCIPTGSDSDIKKISIPDVIFICVKSYDLPEAINEISKIANHHTIIIPLLNGFNIYDRIRSKIETGLVLPACIYLGGRKLSDGNCGMYGPTGMIYYGADPMRSEYIPTDLHTILSDAFDHYINITWQKDPYPAIWQKYMFNVAVNLTNAYSGKALGGILADTALRQIMKNILKETTDVVLRSGAPVPQDVESRIWDLIEKLPCNTKSSYAVDIDNNKLRNEGDIFGTAIIELGKKVHVKTDTIENIFNDIQKKLRCRIVFNDTFIKND